MKCVHHVPAHLSTMCPVFTGGTVAGGVNNDTSGGPWATVGGGAFNVSSGNRATVGGGNQNISSGPWATVGGGNLNTSSGDTATVGGGFNNISSGGYATVPGGYGNAATGYLSFAAGQLAKANHTGTFVWGDSQNFNFASTTNDQFLIRAAGGVGIGLNAPQQQLSLAAGMNIDQNDANSGSVGNTLRFGSISGEAIGSKRTVGGNQWGLDFYTSGANRLSISNNGNIAITAPGSLSFGTQTRQMLNLWGTQYGIGVQSATVYFRTDNADPNNGFSWYKGGVHNDAYANAGGGIELMHLIDGGLYVHGTFNNTSDRNVKENFQPVSAQEILQKVAALPLTRWNYKADISTPHLGPMAQDFYAAFQVGPDDKHIATVDESGVALAAIQGLNQKLELEVKQKNAEIQELKNGMAELKEMVSKLAAAKRLGADD